MLIVKTLSQGCRAFENAFVTYDNQTENNETFIYFKAYTVSRDGWFGIGFGTEKKTDNSTIMLLYSYINSTIFQLVNHSTILPFANNETVIPIGPDDSSKPKLDNYKGFFFKIRYSKAKDYKYLFYAYNGASHNSINNLPFHSSYGVRSINFNTTDYLIGSLDCTNYLGKPGRIGAANIWTYLVNIFIYSFFFILAMYFRDDQPLKSRNYGPHLVLCFVTVNVTLEFISTFFNYEELSKMCWFTFILYPPITGACVCYAVMALRFFLIKIINKQKVQAYERMKGQKNQMISKNSLTFVILKYMASPFFGLFLSFSLMVIEEIIFIFIFGVAFKFDCGNYKPVFIRYIHTAMILLIPCSYIIFQFYDILINFRLIFIERNLKKFYVHDDPFLFRMEVIISIPLAVSVFLWGILTLPDYIRIVLTEIIISVLMVCTGGFALLVTLVQFFSLKCCKKTPKKYSTISGKLHTHDKIEAIFEYQPLFELFLEFSKKEWSMENVLLKNDINKYKNIQTALVREQNAIQIYDKYLNGERSPFEVNLDASTTAHAKEMIEKKYFGPDLFLKVEKAVTFNLIDTYKRFVQTQEYKMFKEDLKAQLIVIGEHDLHRVLSSKSSLRKLSTSQGIPNQ